MIRGYMIISIELIGGDNVGNSIFYYWLVFIKMIGGGGGMIVVEYFMKSFGYGNDYLIIVVMKEFCIYVLEWMEKKFLFEIICWSYGILDISVYLNYLRDFIIKKELEFVVNESKIYF